MKKHIQYSLRFIALVCLPTTLGAQDFLYAPWRSNYNKPAGAAAEKPSCFICKNAQQQDDASLFILKRFQHCFVFLNRYPYGTGHLLVVPFQHCATLDALSPASRAEIMDVTARCCTALQQELHTDGCNIGINIGKAAGASAPDHLHVHILPRWYGDSNFIEKLAHVTVIESDLATMYARLKPYFDTV